MLVLWYRVPCCHKGRSEDLPVAYASSSGVMSGVWGVQTLPKFRSFDKAEPNSQFHGKYMRNNLTRMWGSLIF